MGRYRSRSRSYSPVPQSRSPPRRKRYEDTRDSHRGSSRSYRERRTSGGPSGLLIRNISLDARPEDLRTPFERFGPVKDVYLPKNYYTGEPRGFGFVKFRNGEDAAEAKRQMNHQVIGGREITIVYAEENRKTPQEMRKTTRVSSRHGGGSRRRTPPRSPRHRHRSYSRSPSPTRRDSRDRGRSARGDDYYSPRRSASRSLSPVYERERRSEEREHRSVERERSRSVERVHRSGERERSRSVERVHRSGERERRSGEREHRSVERERRSGVRGHKSEERERSPDERDQMPDERDQRANERDRTPDERDHRPVERDHRQDKRSPSPRANGHSPSRSRSYSPQL